VRVFRFNAVGVLGFGVQVGLLMLLVDAGLHYLPATVLAVETAILHNFAWHERWTWRDRSGRDGRLRRLGRFHLVNGGVSITGNVLLMPLLVRAVGLPIVPANLVAALVCAAVNFAGADRFVFSHKVTSAHL
jgi:putative flippase GtrA